MLKRKSLSVLIASSLVVSGLSAVPAFAAETAAPAASTTAAATVKFQIQADAAVSAQLQTYKDLLALFTTTPDLAGIKAKYISDIQAAVKAVDPAIDENISVVLNMAVEGTLGAGQAKQALDKGLQWYFYALTKVQIGTKAKAALEKGDAVTAKIELDKAIQVYEGLLSATAAKRDNTFNTNIKGQMDTVIVPALQADVEAKDVLSFNLHRQMFDKSLIKMFLLATLTYAQNTPGKAPADQPAAMTEGYFFFLPIYGSLKGGSAADADYVLNAFASGDVSKLDLAEIKASMFRAVEAKASGYVVKTLDSMKKNDLANAQITAIEGNMFLAALETFLPADVYKAAAAEGELYLSAVAAGDYSAAEAHSFNVLQALSGTSGISLTIGTKALVANGSTIEMDVASFLDDTTDRTLVPARFIAEALGAAVDYEEATETVIITKAGVKTELVLGSDQVVRDGAVVESLKLDQPAVLVADRTFIPLRAIAELFGNKVFYHEGEIVIVK